MTDEMKNLIELSHQYGGNTNFVRHGGGNTSCKDENIMAVKASGFSLGTIEEKGFVVMDQKKMQKIWEKTYSDNDVIREKEVLEDMMNCRVEGQTGRPSVEALLHSQIPFKYVVHTHPALVNGMTCGVNGKEIGLRLFPDSLWIEVVKPGYTLAKKIHDEVKVFIGKHKHYPQIIFLQNHGVFVAGASPEEINSIYKNIMDTLGSLIKRKPATPDFNKIQQVQNALKEKGWEEALFGFNDEMATRIKDEKSFAVLAKPYTPDHIVYSGAYPLFIKKDQDVSKISDKVLGKTKLIVVEGLGCFARNQKALDLFMDTLQVACYSESFGGNNFLEEWMINFICGWEVESYRSNLGK